MITNTGLIRAVAYYRMSSDKQDKSIAQQRHEVEKYAKANGYGIIRWKPYVDEGISGDESARRLGFMRLIDDAQERNDFEVIICWDQDRFSRFDPLEANHYWYLLKQSGVRIVTVAQGELNFDDLAGWLSASVTQYGKSQYLKDLSRNCLRGKLERAKQGKWCGSKVKYGYKMSKDGKIVLGKRETVHAVKWIFKTYATKDISLLDLAEQLNDRGMLSPSGGTWTNSSVRHILTAKIYLGTAVQFREERGKHYTVHDGNIQPRSSVGPQLRPETDWIKMECPKIISQEIWDTVHAKMQRRRRRNTPKKNGGRGLLNGLLYCGHCGKPMHASEIARKGGKSDTTDLLYACSTYARRGKHGCHRNSIYQSLVVDYLVARIRDSRLSSSLLEKLKREIWSQLIKREQTNTEDTAQLRRQIAKMDKEITAALKDLRRTPDDLYDLAAADIRKTRDQRDHLNAQLASEENVLDSNEASLDDATDQVLKQLYKLNDAVKAADPRVARGALQTIVERIDLWFEHQHFDKITRSTFKKGLVTFKALELCDQPGRN